MANQGKQSARKKIIEELYTLKEGKEMTLNDVMRKLYVDEQKTQLQIAKELHVSIGTVNGWLADCGIAGRVMKWV